MNYLISTIVLSFLFPFISLEANTNQLFPEESSLARMEEIAHNDLMAKELFLSIGNYTNQIKKSTHVAESNMALNRSSFYPFDETRCCREVKDFYISASDIQTPKQKYIIAQAPIPETVNDFWKMIIYKNCSLIITACMPLESNHDRCTSYWSTPFLPSKVMEWNLFFIKEKVLKNGPNSQRIVARHFLVHNNATFQRRNIIQLHLENWPDYGIPDFNLFQDLIKLTDKYSGKSKNPILVHCSAGIGRSGTFVAAHSLHKERHLNCPEINIPQRIYDLRHQRMELVSTTKQFQFIYKSLLFNEHL